MTTTAPPDNQQFLDSLARHLERIRDTPPNERDWIEHEFLGVFETIFNNLSSGFTRIAHVMALPEAHQDFGWYMDETGLLESEDSE